MKKRILSMLLAVVLVCSLCVPTFAESADTGDGTQYQTVFIHGLLGFGYNDLVSELLCYWGCTSGDMLDYLTDKGYDVINASIGPCSSCWDRCCELFAQLTGTVTDYGAAHSAEVAAAYANSTNDLKHDRFGRDYTDGAIADCWGPVYENGKVVGWYDNKLNLVGHSFGGPAALMFLQLLAEGDEDEINWGKEQAKLYGGDWHDYVSPLFWGDYDGEYLINSVTSLAGVLNGTTFLSSCKDPAEFIMTLVTGLANTIGLTDISYFYDFQLEQFGISKVPGRDLTPEEFFSSKKVKAFLAGYDNAIYDLSIQGCNDLKQGWNTYDNVYYFGYAGSRTHLDKLTGNYVPDADMSPLFMPFAAQMGSYEYSFEQIKDVNGKIVGNPDASWKPNDGLVNTVSARYPLGAANKPYDPANIEAGIWQWKDMRYDHMTFCGGILDLDPSRPAETKEFFLELMSNISASSPVENPDKELFNDIASSGYRDFIIEAAKQGLVMGYPDGSFRPNAPVTRAQFVTMLWRAAGEPAVSAELGFKDADTIAEGYKNAVMWGVAKGVIAGYNDDTFRPNQKISRAQMAAFMYRYMKNVEGFDFGEVSPAGFSDYEQIAPAYREAVNAVVSAGIMSGVTGTVFDPNGTANRGMAAAVMLRMYNLLH
ncbi:MAG: S-layer homology domain-containing protein [Oscillospiraceae bacterium]|nr:S-layer homology domain-containing protein [Oscillospiraceae bacterium]